MKKTLLTVIVLLLGICAQAQIVSSHSKVKYKEKKERKTEWILRGGLNVSNISGESKSIEIDDFEPYAAPGYNISFGLNHPLGQKGLYFGAEIGLFSAGYCNDYSDGISDNFLELSPYLGWKFKLTDKIKLDAHLGMFYGVSIAAGEDELNHGYSYVGDYDAGISYGVGVWFNKFNIDLSYKVGLEPFVTVHEYGEYVYNSRIFMLRLGYAF